MATLEEFVPQRASREEWERYHLFRRQRQQEDRPEEPTEPDALAEDSLTRPDSRREYRSFGAHVDGRMVGLLRTEVVPPRSPEYETNRHLMWVDGWVLESHRGQGLGRSMVPVLVELMNEYGATVASFWTAEDSGHGFLRAIGAEPRMTDAESRLDVRRVDWEMVSAWVREAEASSNGARLQLFPYRLPDDVLDEFCLAATELYNTAPNEDMEHGDSVLRPEEQRQWYERLDAAGAAHVVCLLRDRDGSVVGMTDVVKYPHEEGWVRQHFTGVHPRARGRGYGKWLKAAMLLHLRQVHPDTTFMTTENAGSNAPMLAINRQLGFQRFRTTTWYQVGRDELATPSGAAPRGRSGRRP